MKNVLKILTIVAFLLATFGQSSLALAAETSNIDCRLKPISGPVDRTTESVKYVFSPGKYADNEKYECFWGIGGEEIGPGPCKIEEKIFSISQPNKKVSVELYVKKKGDLDLICKTTDEFIIGDRRQIIERKLENQYPILPGNFRISTSTLPSQLIRYVFVLALSAIGLIALFSLIVSGASWVIGDQERAKKMLGNVATGIVLLLSVYVIINFVNPELLKIKDPILPQINIQIDERLKNILKKCRELGIKADCSVYDGEPEWCDANYCSVPDSPCTTSVGGACVSAKDLCGGINSCAEYQTADFNNGRPADNFKYSTARQNACQDNICNVEGGCIADKIGAAFTCVSPDEKLQQDQGLIPEEEKVRCSQGAITRCEDYNNFNSCTQNSCVSSVSNGPCVFSNNKCQPKIEPLAMCQQWGLDAGAECGDYSRVPGMPTEQRRIVCEENLCGVANKGQCSFVAGAVNPNQGVCVTKGAAN